MGFLDILAGVAATVVVASEQMENNRIEQEKARAKQIYRNGGSCTYCRFKNPNDFCDCEQSRAYDEQYPGKKCESIYGVGVCSYYSKK